MYFEVLAPSSKTSAYNVCVAASGVFFMLEDYFGGAKVVQTDPGWPKLMCQFLLCDWLVVIWMQKVVPVPARTTSVPPRIGLTHWFRLLCQGI